MLQGTRMQRFSQDGLRDTQRGDRSFSTFPGQLHIPRDPSCFYLFVGGTSPPTPPPLHSMSRVVTPTSLCGLVDE